MRRLYGLRYVVGRGARGMSQAPLVQLLAIATIAVCMLLLGTVVLAWVNARSIADGWGVDVPVTVYLVDGVEPDAIERLAAGIARRTDVAEVTVVEPAQAMARLAEGLGADAEALEGIDAEVLPSSLELTLHDASAGAALAEQLRAEVEVDEVVVAGAWAARAQSLLETLRRLAFAAAALVGFACLTIVWSTIRLAVYARRAEIQILRLVGGTTAFVHGPFVVEGLVQGACGAAVAVVLLGVGFDAVQPLLADVFALAFAAGSLRFFTVPEAVALVAFGATLGVLGSRAAVARHIEG